MDIKSIEEAKSILSKFTDHNIDCVNCCRDILYNYNMFILSTDGWINITTDEEIDRVKSILVSLNVCEGDIDSDEDFEEIYNALDFLAENDRPVETAREFTFGF